MKIEREIWDSFLCRKSERVRSEGGLLFLGDIAAFGFEGNEGKGQLWVIRDVVRLIGYDKDYSSNMDRGLLAPR